jgi:hypothetical protein
MSLIQRARLVLPTGTTQLTWSSTGQVFNGYAVFDYVGPRNWWEPEYPSQVNFRKAPDLRAPHRIVVPVVDGKYPDQEVVPFSDEYDSRESWYIVHYHDRARNFVAGPTTLFKVDSNPFVMDFPAIQFPNNVEWPDNPFSYTILFVDQTHGDNTNPPTGALQMGQYLMPWKNVHNLEWFQPNQNNAVLIRRDQHSPWVNITDDFPSFTQE